MELNGIEWNMSLQKCSGLHACCHGAAYANDSATNARVVGYIMARLRSVELWTIQRKCHGWLHPPDRAWNNIKWNSTEARPALALALITPTAFAFVAERVIAVQDLEFIIHLHIYIYIYRYLNMKIETPSFTVWTCLVVTLPVAVALAPNLAMAYKQRC